MMTKKDRNENNLGTNINVFLYLDWKKKTLLKVTFCLIGLIAYN